MTGQQAQKVLELYQSGHMIKYAEGPYVNGFASVWDSNGVIMLSDDVYVPTPLTDLSARYIEVYKPIDWRD